jgi:UDP-glucose 4-epimerase
VLKPAESTSLTALLFAEVCQQAELPAGVVNIVTGDGSTGALIVNHPGIDKIAFTGSTEVGKIIARAVAPTNKSVTLELGGKAANIVFDDAPIDETVEGIVNGIFFNQGHVCCAGSRLLLQENVAEIRIFSRDEKKQDDMRKRFNNSKLQFYIGDVRDYQSVLNATRGVDFIFHAAALKQVPSCEFYPLEAVKTNVLGTENVLEAAIVSGVSRVICLSTDKAVYPINAMGISKAMMEKIFVAKSRSSANTVICGTRYGNVMASRGSVIPLFVNQIRGGQPITITDQNMTRFMMTLEDAVDLVLYAFDHGTSGDIFVQKAPAATIETLALALTDLLNLPKHPIQVIGTRHGEKLYEALLSREEMACAEDLQEYYRIPPDLRDLNYGKFVEQGEVKISDAHDYNSHNTQRLNVEEMKQLLLRLPFMRAAAAGAYIEPEG